MGRETVEDAVTRRVEAQVQRNTERLNQRYSATSDSARRSIQIRERYVQSRALGRSA